MLVPSCFLKYSFEFLIGNRHLVHLLGHGFKFLFHGHARTHFGSLDGTNLYLCLGFRDELGKACGRF